MTGQRSQHLEMLYRIVSAVSVVGTVAAVVMMTALSGALAVPGLTPEEAPAAVATPQAERPLHLAQATFVRQDVHYSDTIVTPPPILGRRSCVACQRTATGTATQKRVVERHWYRAHANTPRVASSAPCHESNCQFR